MEDKNCQKVSFIWNKYGPKWEENIKSIQGYNIIISSMLGAINDEYDRWISDDSDSDSSDSNESNITVKQTSSPTEGKSTAEKNPSWGTDIYNADVIAQQSSFMSYNNEPTTSVWEDSAQQQEQADNNVASYDPDEFNFQQKIDIKYSGSNGDIIQAKGKYLSNLDQITREFPIMPCAIFGNVRDTIERRAGFIVVYIIYASKDTKREIDKIHDIFLEEGYSILTKLTKSKSILDRQKTIINNFVVDYYLWDNQIDFDRIRILLQKRIYNTFDALDRDEEILYEFSKSSEIIQTLQKDHRLSTGVRLPQILTAIIKQYKTIQRNLKQRSVEQEQDYVGPKFMPNQSIATWNIKSDTSFELIDTNQYHKLSIACGSSKPTKQINRIVIDYANARKALNMSDNDINEYIKYMHKFGITSIIITDDKNHAMGINTPCFISVVESNITDDILIIATSQLFNAPIYSKDFYSDFIDSLTCKTHLKEIVRSNVKCQSNNDQADDQDKCDLAFTYRKPATKFAMRRRWINGNFINQYSDPPRTKIKFYSKPSYKNYDGSRRHFSLMQTIIVTISQCEYVLSLWEFEGEYYATITGRLQCSLGNPLLIEEIHDDRIKQSIDTELIFNEKGIRITGQSVNKQYSDNLPSQYYNKFKNIRLQNEQGYYSLTNSIEIADSIDHSICFRLNRKPDFEKAQFEYLDNNSIYELFIDAYFIVDDIIIRSRMQSNDYILLVKAIIEHVGKTNKSNKTAMLSFPITDGSVLKATQIDFSTLNSVTGDNVRGMNWLDQEQISDTMRDLTIASGCTHMALFSDQISETVDLISIMSLDKPKITDQNKDRNRIFNKTVLYGNEIDRSISDAWFPVILPSTHDKLVDSIVVNCGYMGKQITSTNYPASASDNGNDLSLLVNKIFRMQINEILDTYKSIREEKPIKMIRLVYGFEINRSMVNNNALLPVHITYHLPFGLAYVIITHYNDNVAVFVFCQTKPPIMNAVADAMFGMETLNTITYNDFSSELYENEAMEMFFSNPSDDENMMDSFQCYTMLYCILCPFLKKTGSAINDNLHLIIIDYLAGKPTFDYLSMQKTVQYKNYYEVLDDVRTKITKKLPSTIDKHMIHDIMYEISRWPFGVYRNTAIRKLMLSIPGLADTELINEHLLYCCNSTITKSDTFKTLSRLSDKFVKKCIVKNKIYKLDNTIVDKIATKKEILILQNRRIFTLDIDDYALQMTIGTIYNHPIKSIKIDFDKTIILKTSKDKTDRLNNTLKILGQSRSHKISTYEYANIGQAINQIPYDISNNIDKTINNLQILMSDSLPSILKGKDMNQIKHRSGFMIYIPDDIAFSLLRSKIVGVDLNKETIEKEISSLYKSIGNKEIMSDKTVEQPTFVDKMWSKGKDQASKLSISNALALIAVVVALLLVWMWFGWLVALPRSALSLLFSNQTTNWFGVSVRTLPIWAEWLAKLGTCFMYASVAFGVWSAYQKVTP